MLQTALTLETIKQMLDEKGIDYQYDEIDTIKAAAFGGGNAKAVLEIKQVGNDLFSTSVAGFGNTIVNSDVHGASVNSWIENGNWKDNNVCLH